MNKSQETVLLVTAVVIFLMLVIPPFHFESGNYQQNMGYAFIFSPPYVGSSYSVTATVDIGMLFAEWAGALLIGGILFVLLRDGVPVEWIERKDNARQAFTHKTKKLFSSLTVFLRAALIWGSAITVVGLIFMLIYTTYNP